MIVAGGEPPVRLFRRRPGSWPAVLLAIFLVGAVCVLGVVLRPPAASAANLTASQCNGIAPGAPGGATTSMTCTVTIVNTIDGVGLTSSTASVSATCANNPCTPASVPVFSNDLITTVDQCNGSDNDTSQQILCTVDITNNISAAAPEAEPVTAASVHQCVGSATTGTPHCSPFPATTTGATVTQCDGSGNGGAAATVVCTVSPSEVSRAIPITVNQCNGTGNAGASTVTCTTIIRTVIVPVVVTSPSASGGPTTSGSPTPSGSGRPTASASGRPTTSASGQPTRSGRPTTSASGQPTGRPTSTGTGSPRPRPTTRPSGGTRSPTPTPTATPTSTRTPTPSQTAQVTQMPSGGADTGS